MVDVIFLFSRTEAIAILIIALNRKKNPSTTFGADGYCCLTPTGPPVINAVNGIWRIDPQYQRATHNTKWPWLSTLHIDQRYGKPSTASTWFKFIYSTTKLCCITIRTEWYDSILHRLKYSDVDTFEMPWYKRSAPWQKLIITLQCDIVALVWLFGPANVTFWTCQCDFSALRLSPASGTLPR